MRRQTATCTSKVSGDRYLQTLQRQLSRSNLIGWSRSAGSCAPSPASCCTRHCSTSWAPTAPCDGQPAICRRDAPPSRPGAITLSSLRSKRGVRASRILGSLACISDSSVPLQICRHAISASSCFACAAHRPTRSRRHVVRASADVAERSGPTGRDVFTQDGRNFRPTSNRGWEVMSTLLQEKQVHALSKTIVLSWLSPSTPLFSPWIPRQGTQIGRQELGRMSTQSRRPAHPNPDLCCGFPGAGKILGTPGGGGSSQPGHGGHRHPAAGRVGGGARAGLGQHRVPAPHQRCCADRISDHGMPAFISVQLLSLYMLHFVRKQSTVTNEPSCARSCATLWDRAGMDPNLSRVEGCSVLCAGWSAWQVLRKLAFAFFGIANGTGAPITAVD